MDQKPGDLRQRLSEAHRGVSPRKAPQPAAKTETPSRVVGASREPLLTTAQVAKWLEISPRTVCLWAELQEIPAFKLGHQWRFRERDIRQWLDKRSSSDIPG